MKPMRDKTILVVEDEPALLSVLVDKLTREGFVTIGAKDGKEGLSRALLDHPDLILLDIIMPVMDGITMLSKLREDTWGKDAKVILLTNLSEAERVADSSRHGVSSYLVKSDWKMADVVKIIKKTLGMTV